MDARLTALRRLPWPAIAPAAALLALIVGLIRSGLRLTDGRFVYTLDDPYIQMAMAKNLALHGDWAVTPGHFEPASSSPLWTLLLAGVYRLVGVSDLAPLVIDVLVSLGVVFVLERLLRPFLGRGLVRGFVVLAIALAIPLPALVLTGMEAPLHVLLTLLLVWAVAGRSTTASGTEGSRIVIGTLSALCVLTRLESLLLIGPLALSAWLRRCPGTGIAALAGAVAALGGYMMFALPQGGLWLPNSVLLKSPMSELATAHDWGRFLLRIPENIVWHRNSHMAALLLAAGWFLLPDRRARGPRSAGTKALLATFVAASLLHVQFASLGWFYRYEAYLVALGLMTIVVVVASGEGRLPGPLDLRRLPVLGRAVALLVLLALATPLATRSLRSLKYTPLAMRNIYEQPYQVGRFVKAHFRDREIAVNDLGIVGYYGGARVEDLFGLATTTVARAKLERRYGTEFIERHCASRGVEVALVYEPWFTGTRRLPESWRALARWTIPQNVSSDASTVTILATNAASADRVRAALLAFIPSLPTRVRVEMLN